MKTKANISGQIKHKKSNQKRISSFICERTSEYYISNAFIQAAVRLNLRPAPLFFWASREGASRSIERNSQLNMKVAAVYARRPKLPNASSDLYIKINWDLLNFAEAAARLKLYCFASTPVARSFDELYHSSCAWLDLTSATARQELVAVEPERRSHPADWSNTEEIVKLLSLQPSMPWPYWANTIESLRPNLGQHPVSIFSGPKYKPFYIALMDRQNGWHTLPENQEST